MARVNKKSAPPPILAEGKPSYRDFPKLVKGGLDGMVDLYRGVRRVFSDAEKKKKALGESITALLSEALPTYRRKADGSAPDDQSVDMGNGISVTRVQGTTPGKLDSVRLSLYLVETLEMDPEEVTKAIAYATQPGEPYFYALVTEPKEKKAKDAEA